MGLTQGYLMYFYIMDDESQFMFKKIKFYPFIIAGLSAVISSLVITVNKKRTKKYIFEHFYLMAFGMIFFMIGGGLFINRWSRYFNNVIQKKIVVILIIFLKIQV